ncbi:methylated-DNA--[protein]-cysteine S-methyltransferase [Candidatus Sumerlaeota bacterium]|nr:methylated-DNA--[protein]-cysteine S-methyltransferase [Candidatus Sumerlaeota bacterium]
MKSILFKTSWGWCGAGLSPQGLALVQLPFSERSVASKALEARVDSFLAGRSRDDSSVGKDASRARGTLDALARSIEAQVQAYFEGRLTEFDLPLDWTGVTRFRRRVWQATRRIPFGATLTYGELARKVGIPAAARAVGGALGANPIPPVVPCHRVLGARGALAGYSAVGGTDLKKRLIEFEAAVSVGGTGGTV